MCKFTKIVNYINENGYELKELNYGWYSTHENDDSVYLEFYIQKLNLEVIIEKVNHNSKVSIFRNKNGKTYEVGGIVCRTQNDILKGLKEIIEHEEQLQNEVVPYETIEETQETSYNYGKDSMDENCMNNKSSMLIAINNKDSQESICNFVPCGATKEPTETVEPLLSLNDDITTQVFTSDHTSAPMFMANQLRKMIDTILYENDTDSFGTCKIAVYDHVDENKKPIYGIHVLENDYMIEFDKNTQAVTKIYENEFGFECGLSLATRDYIFNPLMKKIADEIETIYNGLER